MAKIHVTYKYTKYEYSKLATAISIFKGSFGGFLGWMGLFLIPLIVSAGVASQTVYAWVAIVVVLAVALISYGCLFFIKEEKIAERKERKLGISTDSIRSQAIGEAVSLRPVLEKKLNGAKNRFIDLTTKFSKEEVFSAVKDECYNDLAEFLLLFQYNSSGVRITFSDDTPTEDIKKGWDKADIYLETICLYHLLLMKDTFSEHKKIAVFDKIKNLIKRGEIDWSDSYQSIRDYVINRIKHLPNVVWTYCDWEKASIISSM